MTRKIEKRLDENLMRLEEIKKSIDHLIELIEASPAMPSNVWSDK